VNWQRANRPKGRFLSWEERSHEAIPAINAAANGRFAAMQPNKEGSGKKGAGLDVSARLDPGAWAKTKRTSGLTCAASPFATALA
jgi:hypothetical protein